MFGLRTLVPSCMLMLGCAALPADNELADPDSALAEPAPLLQPTLLEHGEAWFGAREQAELSAREPIHGWTFRLSAAATVAISTAGSASGPDLDTTLALYRMSWNGRLRPVARNDDVGDSGFSAISRELPAGRYRVVVRARTRSSVGPFVLASHCDGAGCPLPEEARDCVFGRKVSDLPTRLRASTILNVRSVEQLPDAAAQSQLVEASAHLPDGPLGSAEELFDAVDSGLVRWLRLWDDAAGRAFSAYEFHVGGESYGAVFDAEGQPAARIDEAQIVVCTVPVQSCRLGRSFRELRDGPGFVTLASEQVDAQVASTLTALQRSQLLEAVRVAYADAEDVVAALASVDANQVNHLSMRESATGMLVDVYEYGAGDNSYGAVFASDDLTLLARIEDGAFTSCKLLE